MNFQSVSLRDKFYCTFASFLSILFDTSIHCFIFRLVTLSLSLYFSALSHQLNQRIVLFGSNLLISWLLGALHGRLIFCCPSIFRSAVAPLHHFEFHGAIQVCGYGKLKRDGARRKFR